MEEREYEVMFKAEESHWWYQGMDSITRALLKVYLPQHPNLSILDAGCGTGKNLHDTLPSYGRPTGIDSSPLALGFCRQRQLTQIARTNIASLPFSANSFDAVISLDVLYSLHVENDEKAVHEIHRVLKPGGVVFIRVAAYEWLRGQHDIAVHTGRRYTKQSLKKLVEGSGFSIQKLTYANCFLFPLVAAKRLSDKWAKHSASVSDTDPDPGIFNSLLLKILSSEAPFILHKGLPFGTSVLCVGVKE